MTRVGYFCTGGHTETGGIEQFLQKINPRVRWGKCLPATLKPPKFKRGLDARILARDDEGDTGEALLNKMIERLQQHGFDYDYLLVIDDADCRFNEGSTETFESFHAKWQAKIDETLGRHVPFYVLFASPEVEGWLLADWDNSFKKEYPSRDYPQVEHELFRYIQSDILGEQYREDIENFGGALLRGACTIKISTQIQNAFVAEELGSILLQYPKLRYNKNSNGSSMLKRIDPERVAGKCRRYFAPTYRELSQL